MNSSVIPRRMLHPDHVRPGDRWTPTAGATLSQLSRRVADQIGQMGQHA